MTELISLNDAPQVPGKRNRIKFGLAVIVQIVFTLIVLAVFLFLAWVAAVFLGFGGVLGVVMLSSFFFKALDDSK